MKTELCEIKQRPEYHFTITLDEDEMILFRNLLGTIISVDAKRTIQEIYPSVSDKSAQQSVDLQFSIFKLLNISCDKINHPAYPVC